MSQDTVVRFRKKDGVVDPLTQLLREGAQQLISQAVSAELELFLEHHGERRDGEGRRAVVVLTDGVDTKSRLTAADVTSIASGMTPDSAKTYVTNFLDSTITVIFTATGSVLGTINLLANYDPISGAVTGPFGALPIQTPVSPNGKYMVTANVLSDTITIVDVATDTVVAMLPCPAGCHGVQFGAKQGGGYYAYVSSKFSNVLTVVDPDPDNDGNASDAVIAGRVVLAGSPSTASDDVIVGNAGMGGQGVLAIPVVYNGWVQNLPVRWKAQLTPDQIDPIP